MEIHKSENKHFIQLEGIDHNGEDFKIEIQKDCSQIRVKQEFGNICIELDYNLLTLLSNSIREVLEAYKKRL